MITCITSSVAYCVVIVIRNQACIQTILHVLEISFECIKYVAAQKCKRTCITVLNTLSHYAIKIFVSWAL